MLALKTQKQRCMLLFYAYKRYLKKLKADKIYIATDNKLTLGHRISHVPHVDRGDGGGGVICRETAGQRSHGELHRPHADTDTPRE